MSEKDKANIAAILDAIQKISEYVSGIADADEYYRSRVVFDATLMNFIVIGESVDRISQEMKVQHPSIDWQKIKDFRNLVAHDYLGIDAEEVWQIIHKDLPQLRSQLEPIAREQLPD
jgi:uncharacterized protein with HEPN domain